MPNVCGGIVAKKRRSRAEWAELVVRFEASGQSASAFAARHGLNANTLKWWRSQLRAGSLYRKRQEKPPPGKASRPAPKKRSARAAAAELPHMVERLVNRIADEPGLRTRALALTVAYDIAVVRQELRELEELGIVYRRGRGPATRWYLG
jgi:transposase-like protein